MKLLKLANVCQLVADMRTKKENLIIFPFDFWQRRFSCLMALEEKRIRLFVTVVGAEKTSAEFSISEDCSVCTYVSERDYLSLLQLLGIRHDRGGLFKPLEFFEALDRKAPTYFPAKTRSNMQPATNQGKNSNDEASFFVGWRKSPTGRCSKKNSLKTRAAFPSVLAELAISHGVSSCWSKNKKRAKQILINDLLSKIC